MLNWIQVWRVPGTFSFAPEAGNLVCVQILVTFGGVRRCTILHKNCFRPGFHHFSLDQGTGFCYVGLLKILKTPVYSSGINTSRLGRRQPALAWNGDKVDFAYASGGGTRAAVTQRARVKCVVIDKPSDAQLRNQGTVTEQDVRKRLICDFPVSLPYLNRQRKQSRKRYRI